MELLKNKPYAACGLVFILTAVICAAFPVYIKSGIAAVGSGLFLCFLFYRFVFRQRITGTLRENFRFLLLSLLYIALAAVGSYLSFGISGYYADTGVTCQIRARVTSVESSAVYGSVYDVTLENIDGRRVPYLCATLRVSGVFERGDIIETDASFNDDGTDFDRGLFKNARKLYITAENATLISQNPTPADRVYSLNSFLSARLAVIFGDETGGLAAALFLGNKEHLAPETERDFRRVGVAHMLALSGMHLILLSSIADRLMIRMEIKPRKRHIAVICLTLCYMFLCGMTASIARAGLMLIFMRISVITKRKSDSFTALVNAAVVMLVLSPSSLVDVSFQLSFIAMLAIEINIRTRMRYRIFKFICGSNKRGTVVYYLLSSLSEAVFSYLTTLTVLIIMLPLSWLYFGELSLLSPVSNILFSPLVSAILYITPIALLFSPFLQIVPLFDFILGLFSNAAISLAGKLSVLHGIVLPLSNEFSPIFVCVIFIGAAVFLFGGKKLIKLSVGAVISSSAVLVALSVAVCFITADDVYVLPLCYDTNDIIMFAADNALTLTDVTDGSAIPMRKAAVKAKREGFCEIENIVYTHIHSRHATTLRRICCDNIVRCVYIPVPESEAETTNAERLVSVAMRCGVRVIAYSRSYSNACDIGSFSMIFPPYTEIKRSTHPVIMFLAATNEGSCVYIGASVSESTLETFAERTAVSSGVVIFGSHGPSYKQQFDYIFTPSKRYVYFMGNSCEYASTDTQNDSFNHILIQNFEKAVFINPGIR